MTTKKVVTLSSVKQLIDLNGTSTNVDVTFTAKSLDNSDFYALVVDQRTLDSNVPLEFKLARGSISANIISDNNVYQNHFLCLKSDKPCQVEVVIDKKEIQSANFNIPQPQQQVDESVIHRQREHFAQNHQNKTSTNWVLIFVVCALAAGGLAYYYFVYSKKKAKMTISDVPNQQVVSAPQVVSAQPVLPAPQVVSDQPIPQLESSNSFAARLSKLLE